MCFRKLNNNYTDNDSRGRKKLGGRHRQEAIASEENWEVIELMSQRDMGADCFIRRICRKGFHLNINRNQSRG